MIVSHRHRFIFVKTKKAAGTSLEIALAGICGPEDVITPISPRDEAERARIGHPGPQNLRPPRRHPPGVAHLRRVLSRGDPDFRNHMPAARIRELLPAGTWEAYFTFCFDRNPWDRAVSLFHWVGGERRFGSIADFVRSGEERPFSNYERYAIGEVVAVDRVYRYEDMAAALAEISQTLGLERPLELPGYRAKGWSRGDHRPYREVLSDEERDLIAVVCAREIRLLDYEY